MLLLLFECECAAMLCYHAALLAWLRRTSVMYSFPISAWFHRIIASISGVSTPIIRAMSTKVHRPKGRSVSKNLCCDERERARERDEQREREKRCGGCCCCAAAADLERRDDAAVDGGVRDLVFAEGAVCEDGGDGVPFARDLCCLGIIERERERVGCVSERVARIVCG